MNTEKITAILVGGPGDGRAVVLGGTIKVFGFTTTDGVVVKYRMVGGTMESAVVGAGPAMSRVALFAPVGSTRRGSDQGGWSD